MAGIEAHARPVKQLLANTRYGIDFYQREYRWERRQIQELVDDLEAKFADAFRPEHAVSQVANYPHYFLGSVVLSQRDDRRYIIDGQQRLTSLTLLLMHLKHRMSKMSQLDSLIYSDSFGSMSFNLDVPERDSFEDVVEALDVEDDCLERFTYWLIERVILVEIVATSDDDAYTIFETMNDRGLSLTPAEMLKGYLLANIDVESNRVEADKVWRRRLLELMAHDKKEEEDFFKAWMRAQYAETIRERRKGSVNLDWDVIGTSFHKWVRENKDIVGLRSPADFSNFVQNQFRRYSAHYLQLLKAANEHAAGPLESVFFNARTGFTLQFPVMLAPLSDEDDREIAERKMGMVADFLDIWIARRQVNYRVLGYSAHTYTMFNLIKAIRGLSLDELASELRGRLDEMDDTFAAFDNFGLHQRNYWAVYMLLARLTFSLERESAVPTDFAKYVDRTRTARYDIEHIWSTVDAVRRAEFESQQEFERYRGRLGGLVLIPERENRSVGKLAFPKKRDVYLRANLLAASLFENAYTSHPGFRVFRESSGLQFRAYETFDRAALDERHRLYGEMCERVWSPDRITLQLA